MIQYNIKHFCSLYTSIRINGKIIFSNNVITTSGFDIKKWIVIVLYPFHFAFLVLIIAFCGIIKQVVDD